MATSSPYRPTYGANDWTARLPPGSPSADQGMAVQPYADPGYAMPNPYIGNLNQSPGMAVGGYLQTSGTANPMFQPGVQAVNAAPQNRLAPWSNFGADETPAESDYWLEQARRLRANPEDYGKVEPLPGITSGAAPKPWGLNRDQPTWNQLPAYGPGGRSEGYVGTLKRIRPVLPEVDPGISLGDDTVPGTRSPTPVIMNARPNWKYREA